MAEAINASASAVSMKIAILHVDEFATSRAKLRAIRPKAMKFVATSGESTDRSNVFGTPQRMQ
jgi:hypothetical protein